jgi:poly(A) polymerase
VKEAATEIVLRLQQAGFKAYWVGGCVRDVLLDREPGDYDVATSALPHEIEGLFRRTVPVGRKFGVMVVVEGEEQFEVATFRAESEYRDGRHPEKVTFGDPAADAQRRDFTINGLFYDPIRKELHDWVGGDKDLRDKLIRTIGAARERFEEDHLRLLRAVRLAVQLGFRIETETANAIKELAPTLQSISAERIRDELLKIFVAPHAARGLELLEEHGLLEQVLPEIAATRTCEQSPEYHPEGSVFKHLVKMLGQLPERANPSLPWAVLLHDVAKPKTASRDQAGTIHFYGHEQLGAEMAQAILERLKFPRKQTEEIVKAVRYHMQFKDVLEMRKATVRRVLLRPTFPLELELHRLDCLGSHGQLEVYDFLVEQAAELKRMPQLRPPLLTGDDLVALGMKPGPALGALLAEIREKQLQDELKTPEEAREWAKGRLTLPEP